MDPKVKELVERRASLEFEDRKEVFAREIGNIKERFGARGALHSSMTMVAVQDAVARETRVRASLVWNALARALTSARQVLDDSIATSAKALIGNLVRDNSQDLQTHLDFAAGLLGKPRDLPLEPPMEAALDRINSEVDFALLASSESAAGQDPQVVNIYQSQGIVQTGSHAQASMTISLGIEERSEIKLALQVARDALEQDTGISDAERGNAIQLVDEITGEVEKDDPNRLKVRSGLQGVATVVQTLAAAPHAYALLKGAAALVGADLP